MRVGEDEVTEKKLIIIGVVSHVKRVINMLCISFDFNIQGLLTDSNRFEYNNFPIIGPVISVNKNSNKDREFVITNKKNIVRQKIKNMFSRFKFSNIIACGVRVGQNISIREDSVIMP